MFIKVNANVGFSDSTVTRWKYELVQPPPALLAAREEGAGHPASGHRTPAPARGSQAAHRPAPSHGRSGGESRESVVTPQLGPPVLTALVPAEAAIGDPSFTLSVQGSNFDDGATIVWNGSDEVTTFVSATELTTTVDMTTATTAAALPVQVRNLDLTLSNSMDFQVTAAPEAPPVPQPVPTLTLTFVDGGELVLEGTDAAKVHNYYSVPSSHLTVL